MPDPRESRNICNMLGTHPTAHSSYNQKEHGKQKQTTLFSNHLGYLRNLYMFSTITLKSSPPPRHFLVEMFFSRRSKAPRIPWRRCFRCGLPHSCCWSSHRRCSPPMRCDGRVLQGKGNWRKSQTSRLEGPWCHQGIYETLVNNGISTTYQQSPG